MPEAESLQSAAIRNERVAAAIRAYCRFPHPQGFALMVDGPWGSGKTHLVKSLLDDLAEVDSQLRKPLYVSLYGVKDSGDIGEQIYQQLHPVLGHRYTRLVGAVARGALKGVLKIDLDAGHHETASLSAQFPELSLSEVAGRAAQRVVVFDDFERAGMTPVEVLGFINPLVEHEGCKVLILANEAEVDQGGNYARRKEKTVGRTLRVAADADNALQSFLSAVNDVGAREYLQGGKEDILGVFRDSELNNLRLLKQFVWLFEEFWLTLTAPQKANREATREMAMLLCAATLELRSGRIPPSLFKRSDVEHFMRVRSKDPDPDALIADAVFKRYPTVSFKGGFLAPETAGAIVMEACIPVEAVQQQLGNHPSFEKPTAIPSWQALWHSSKLKTADIEGVLARFEEDFDSRAFRMPGEILHVAGLCLWMADIGQPGWAGHDVMSRLQSYVEDALRSDEGQEGTALSPLDRLAGGAFGLGFYKQEDSRLREVARWIEEAAVARRRRGYPQVADRLHRGMREDSEAFLRDVCFTNQGPSRYARSGVLACIPAREFAATFMAIDRHNQEQVAMALSLRYDQAPDEPELRDELPWLAEALGEIDLIAAGMPSIPRHHITTLVDHYIRKHVQRRSSEAKGDGLEEQDPD